MPPNPVDRVKDKVRTFNKYLLNPLMMRLAGRKHWYASVIRHTGRRSGRHYATPVVADQVDNAFILPLRYGTDVDWLRNVQACGEAIVTSGGRNYNVVAPRVIDAQTAGRLLPTRRARAFERFGIHQFLMLDRVG
ncbi:nitroreductase family deazaflavin-dependent oxidoreductase [Mycolicibacterium novocastrense]|nr:nitroreductase family deazaflavin-dependent oxidoreductase [Mycolicibacterium novocastrense]MCV7022451.1 nitroreductase family deazaflavin-dependent oxidoreductase [Mycolicibacterium novocastrense]